MSDRIVHIVAILAAFSAIISIGLQALADGRFSFWVAVVLLTIAAGNSYHLVTVAAQPGKIAISTESTKGARGQAQISEQKT